MTHKSSSFSGWRLVTLVLLLMMVVAVGPAMAAGGLADSAWPKDRNDMKNTGLSGSTGPQTNTLLWSSAYTTTEDQQTGATIGVDGTVYIGSYDNNLYAFNPEGTLKWKYLTGNQIYGSPTIGADGTIYITSIDKNLYAINPDGTLKWYYTTADANWGSAAIGNDGTIYTGDRSGAFYALNPDGTLKWKDTTVGETFAIAPGFFLEGPGAYAGVTPAIGADGTIYIGGGSRDGAQGALYAFNPDGTVKWSYNTLYTESSAAIGSDGTIYTWGRGTNTANKYFYALNPDGTLKWRYTITGRTDDIQKGSPAIGLDGTIYFGLRRGSLNALNPADGTLKWTYAAGTNALSQVNTPSVGADGTIYFGSANKNVYAVNSDGSLKWKYTTGGKIYGYTTVGPYGTLYVGTSDGKLYAFRDPVSPPVAGFSATPLTGPAPLNVQFTDASTISEKLTYAWDFENDGVVDSTEKSPLFTYANPGTYTVNLTVTNSAGSNTMIKEAYITADKPIGAPEFPTMALPAVLVIGMLGTVLFIRRTKEY